MNQLAVLSKSITRHSAICAAGLLGRLAGHVLKPVCEVREVLQEYRFESRLIGDEKKSLTAGSCQVLFVADLKLCGGTEEDSGWNSKQGLLAPAFFLPFLWKQDRSTHDSRLPETLTQLADSILALLNRDLALLNREAVSASLHLDIRSECETNQKTFLNTLTYESGALALLGGLHSLVTSNVEIDPRVFASVAFDFEQLTDKLVHGLKQKLELAHRLGATAFFVSRSQFDEARGFSEDAAKIVHQLKYDDRPQHRKQSIIVRCGPYLAALGVAPPTEAPDKVRSFEDEPLQQAFDTQRQHYDRLAALDSNAAINFYRQNMIVTVGVKAAREARQRNKYSANNDQRCLITVASGAPELVVMAIEYVEPAKVFVICTDDPDGENFKAETKKLLQAASVKTEARFMKVNPDKLEESLREVVAKRHCQGMPRVFDLTPGPKLFSLVFQDLATDSDQFIYLRHTYNKKHRCAIPGSERWLYWKKGDSIFPS